MRIRISELKEQAKTRPEGYLEDVLSRGKVAGGILYLSGPEYVSLLKKYNPTVLIPSMRSNTGCCGNKPKSALTIPTASFPPILTQATNAAKAVSRVVSNVIHGKAVRTTDEIIAKRKSICQSCEFLKGTRCTKCGCFYSVKITLNSERCPIDKW